MMSVLVVLRLQILYVHRPRKVFRDIELQKQDDNHEPVNAIETESVPLRAEHEVPEAAGQTRGKNAAQPGNVRALQQLGRGRDQSQDLFIVFLILSPVRASIGIRVGIGLVLVLNALAALESGSHVVSLVGIVVEIQ